MEKVRKILMYTGFVLVAVMTIMAVILIAGIIDLNILKKSLLAAVIALMAALIVIIGVSQRWLVPGIITKVISIILTVIIVFGIRYVKATTRALDKISSMKTEINNVCVYVLNDSDYNTPADIPKDKYGIVENLDRENTEKALDMLVKELDSSVSCEQYPGIMQLVNALYDGEVEAIVLNSSFISVFEGVSGYSDIESRLREVWSADIETVIEDNKDNDKDNQDKDNNKDDEKPTENPYDEYKDYLYGGDDVFTLYVSGIDTTGSPMVNRNSDVNILITFNTKTRQILMINTPRDFYVPLSISNGVKDKLTHAGCYGIQVSVDTLEMLYGINIDDYLKVNFTGFVNVIDELGGVSVYSEYAFDVGGDHFTKGNNYLYGREALVFARERHSFGSGDRQRGKNQMAVIKGIIDKCTTTDALLNYENLLEAISSSIATSMSRDEITDFIKMQLSDMRGWNVVTYSVDGSGDNLMTFSLDSPNYVMVPYQETVDKAREYLRKIYAGEIIG